MFYVGARCPEGIPLEQRAPTSDGFSSKNCYIYFQKEDKVRKEEQRLNAIQFWLARTTEQFDDWDYDGKELVIFLNGKPVERYLNRDMKKFIENFK